MGFTFPNHKKKQEEAEALRRAEVRSHIVKLEAGKEKYLAALYPVLLSGDRETAGLAAEAVHRYLSNLNESKLIKLDRQFRQYTSM